MKKEDEKIVKEIVEERIKKNKDIFSQEELKIIKENIRIIEKIYLLGLTDKK